METIVRAATIAISWGYLQTVAADPSLSWLEPRTASAIEEPMNEFLPDTGSVDLDAARIAILVLKASAPEVAKDEMDHVVIKPGREVLSISKAVHRLARLPKPVVCSAESESGRLAIHFSAFAGDRAARLHELFVKMFGGPSGLGRLVMNTSRGDGRVKVIGGQDTVLVPGFGFERWYHDYSLPTTVGLGGRPPTIEEHAAGVTFVVTVGRGQEVPVDTAFFGDTL
ncbi:MAG: hypothetical protein AUI57_03090 [Candidatus Rokubacteria bacterium 13_1_40CM_2_68_8]|nr:MAG: hypothetical protein AUI57_03090 [Candidatus Rokubacteria bacterium 13_1_40CM_2_68_8]